MRPLVLVLPFVAGCYLSHELPRDAAPVDAPRICPAMDVDTLPSCTFGVEPYWWWTGRDCTSSSCACNGEDCDAVMSSESECERVFGGCPVAR